MYLELLNGGETAVGGSEAPLFMHGKRFNAHELLSVEAIVYFPSLRSPESNDCSGM